MRRTALGKTSVSPAIGVYGGENPAAALRAAGHVAFWHNSEIAFAGGTVGMDASGRIVVCGDILLDNAAQLRVRLERPEATEAELLAELYLCHGSNAGRFALGMYAAAIWDIARKKLVLIRDGVGARTIYYSSTGGQTWFSTKLKAVRRSPGVSGDLSVSALRNYLTCAFVPGEETLYKGIREVRPGNAATIGGDSVSCWEPTEYAGKGGIEPISTYATSLRVLLEDSVRTCLPNTGPVGIFLSGGLDSSVVTAVAARVASGPVHSFAIHFGSEYPNELEFSSLVATHCRTEHHIIELPGRTIRDTLIETMATLDDPIGDPLTTPNLILARKAAKYAGITLNGEGGDPCFGGPKNLPMLLHELYAPHESRESAYLRSFQKCYDDLPRLLKPDVKQALKNCPLQESFVAQWLDDERIPDYLDRLMLMNVRMKGADQILTKVNNVSNAAGIISRSPLFDRRIVEAGFAIPAEYKLMGAVEKAVLKEAASDLLPEAIILRPKSGMLVPVQRWFKKELRSYARGMLLSRRSRIRPYLEQSLIKEWLAYEGGPFPRQGVKLWLVLALEAWLRAHEG